MCAQPGWIGCSLGIQPSTEEGCKEFHGLLWIIVDDPVKESK